MSRVFAGQETDSFEHEQPNSATLPRLSAALVRTFEIGMIVSRGIDKAELVAELACGVGDHAAVRAEVRSGQGQGERIGERSRDPKLRLGMA